MELYRKTEAIQDCSSPYLSLCLYRLTRGQSGTFRRSACQWERRILTALQQAEPQTAMCPSRDKVQLPTGLQQQERNQLIEGNGSSPVFSTREPKSGYCIHLWTPQDTTLAKGNDAVSLALPVKMVWGQSTWHERRELRLVQAGAEAATGNRSFQYIMSGNKEDEARPLQDAQRKDKLQRGRFRSGTRKKNFALRAVSSWTGTQKP